MSALAYLNRAASSEYFHSNPPTRVPGGFDAPGEGGPVTDGPHRPVMMREALSWLNPRPAGVYGDATVGYGGHAAAILQASAPDGRLVGIDRDERALEQARARLREFADRVTLVHAPF